VRQSRNRKLTIVMPVVLAMLAIAGLPAQTPAPQTPVFRGGATVVPVDVRVTDSKGQPITDLTQQDFTILENNVRQTIRHFSTQELVATPLPGGPQPLARTAGAPELGAQKHRVFLIVLGRGRLQEPAKGMDAVVDLVKNRLLPQDYVSVLAWNRATDFTTDHARILEVLTRFRTRHNEIEMLMRQRFSGLAAVYGDSKIPGGVQQEIDAIFKGANTPGVRELPVDSIADAARVNQDTRRAADALQRAATLANTSGGVTTLDESADLLGLSMSFDEFAEINAQSMQDVAKLYTGISYLRHVAGEKHLLFVSETGIFLPRTEDDRNLAALAADARVALNVLHTGGTRPPPGGAMGRGGGGVGRGAMLGPDWRISTSQNLAQLTGGQFTSVSNAVDFVSRLDTASRFQYVLGYTPTNPQPDGRYRQIQVRVSNRPGARVYYRHGYFARERIPELDRERVVAYSRVTSAANYPQPVADIGLTVAAVKTKTPAGAHEVQLTVRVAPERLSFTEADGRKKGSIDVAVFCADRSERLIGQTWNTVALEMTPDAYRRFMENGLTYAATVSVRTEAEHVKVVVYDAGADLVGSAMVKTVKKK
jgi:VWFA-related protein